MSNIRNKRINSLTGARFFAIMIIVISHFEFLKNYGTFGEFYWKFFHTPTIGVDYFFMLSGFGLMLSFLNNKDSKKYSLKINNLILFGIKHIKKIYASYVISLLIGLLYIFVSTNNINSQELRYLLSTAFKNFLFDLTLLQSATGLIQFSHSINGVCWFLSTMFCIYLVSPIIMVFLSKFITNKKRAIYGILCTICFSVILAKLFKQIEDNSIFNDLCYGSPYRRVFYVIPGMILAQIFIGFNDTDNTIRKHNGAFEYLSLAISSCWYLLRFSIQAHIGVFVYALDMIIVMCFLYSLSLEEGIISNFLQSPRMVFLGNISLYIFIFHYVIRMFVVFFFKKLKIDSLLIGILEVIIILFITFSISICIYKYNERPRKKL